MAQHVGFMMRRDIIIPKLNIDFVVITSISQIILIKFASSDADACAKQLEKGSTFIKNLLNIAGTTRDLIE